MTSLALGSKLSSINARTRVAKAVANFLTGLPQKLVRTTRAGLATCIGPDGTLQWGPHNLLVESLCDDGFVALGTTPPTVTSFQQFAGESCTSAVFTSAMTATYAGARIDRGNGAGTYKASIVSGRYYIQTNFIGLSRSLTGAEKITVLWTGASGVASVDITSANSAQYVGVLARIATPPAAMVSTGQNYPVIYLNGALSSNLTVYTNKGMLEDVTGTNRTTPSDYVDSTVKNRLSYPNSFNNAFWAKLYSMQVYDNTCTGPTGQPAHTLVAGAASAELYQTVTLAGVYTSGLKIRRRLGTGTVSIRNSANNAWMPLVLTSDWAQFQNDGGTATAGQAYCDILMSTQGDQIDICDAQLNPGSTLWPYSYNAGAAPAVGPIYGLRTDYDPVTLACKGALIESTQVTQLLANPDNIGAAPWAGCVATDDGTKFRGRVSWKVAKANATISENRASNVTSTISGNHTVRVVFLASSNSSQCDFGVWGGTSNWGVTGNTSFTIESGPGAVSNMGGSLWRITGLSTNVPLVVAFTRNFTSSETAQLNIFPDTYNSTTSGRAIYIQVDNLEAGASPTSFIPNPATSGTVVRVADTSSVGYDDLCKALPWLMDTNLLSYPEDFSNGWWTKNSVTLSAAAGTAPDGTNTACKIISAASTSIMGPYSSTSIAAPSVINTQSWYVMAGVGIRYLQMMWSSSSTSAEYANFDLTTGTFTGGTYLGATAVSVGGGWFRISMSSLLTAYPGGCWITAITNPAAGRAETYAGNGTDYFLLWGAKLNPGPVAQTYYPQASKQGTIVFEGDLVFGPASGGMSLFALENGASNRVELYKGSASNTLSGLFNVNSGSPGNIASGTIFKSLIGFSPSSAGAVLNGGAETAITPSAFSANPNVLKIGNDANGNAASSMHLRRLRIFNTNLPASTKQSLTR